MADRSLKILAVCQHYWPEPFNVSEICEELVQRGHKVTVLTGLPNYPEGSVQSEYRKGKNRSQTHNGVDIIRVPLVSRGANLQGFNKLRRVFNYVSFEWSGSIKTSLMKESFDRVLIFQYSPVLMAVPGLRFAERHGIPSLLYCFDLWPEDLLTGGMSKSGIPYRCMRRISRSIYSRANVLAVTSPGFARYFESELGLDNLNVKYLPQFSEKQFEDLAGESGEKRETLHLLFAGNIGGNQSVQTIVRAAARINGVVPVIVDIVGTGSQFDECKNLADELLADNVVFHGRHPLSEMPSFYSSADGTIITLSKPQGESLVPELTIPRKLQSYMAIGKPILASVPGETKRIVEESGGIAVDPEDDEGLAMAMAQLASMPRTERNKMGKTVREYYRDHFSRERFFVNLESILETMGV